jgi:phosphatidylglycerophosphate synthase
MNKIPITLIFARLAIGLIIIWMSAIQVNHYSVYAVILLSIGLLTDIFDGIIARKLNISTQTLRRLDSTIDQVFFISFAVATYIQCPDCQNLDFVSFCNACSINFSMPIQCSIRHLLLAWALNKTGNYGHYPNLKKLDK